MPQNVKAATGAPSEPLPPDFEPIEFYERLIRLRTEDPEAFKRQASDATIATLVFYERSRAQSESETPK